MTLSIPRHFFDEDIAGICVRDGLISASRMAMTSDGAVRMRNVGWMEYDPKLSDDELSAAIRHAWRQFRMPTRTVVGCLHSASIQYKLFQYDNLAPDELEPALTLEAEDLLRLPIAKITMDRHVFRPPDTGETSPRNPGRLEGVLIAAPSDEVERFFLTLKHAGLYTVILDIGPLAAANLFHQLRPVEDVEETVCLLDLCGNSADMTIMCRDGFAYPRSLRSYADPWDRASDYLAENVADFLRYTKFRLRKPVVQRIYLTGRSAGCEGLADTLEETLGLPVGRWNPLDYVEDKWPHSMRSDEVRKEIGPWLSAALGLALRGAAYEPV